MTEGFIRYTAGYKYMLEVDYRVLVRVVPKTHIQAGRLMLTTDGFLTIRAGYGWDGASGPMLDTNSVMRASLIHDALYELIRLGHLELDQRAACDEEFDVAAEQDGCPRWRRWYTLQALRLRGTSRARPSAQRLVLRAP